MVVDNKRVGHKEVGKRRRGVLEGLGDTLHCMYKLEGEFGERGRGILVGVGDGGHYMFKLAEVVVERGIGERGIEVLEGVGDTEQCMFKVKLRRFIFRMPIFFKQIQVF